MEKNDWSKIYFTMDPDKKKPIGEFIDEIVEDNLKKEHNEDDEKYETSRCAFSIGFVYGQMFDLWDKEARETAETIKKKLIDAGVLTYGPRRA